MTREFDIIVFGATGMAGRYCIEQLHKSSDDKLSWAIAGRNEAKLKDVLAEVSSWIGENLESVTTVIADVDQPATLSDMAARTRCVINTVGPYTKWGENVIKACLEEQTHLLDLSGELHFNETMRNKYHDMARERGVIVLATAGFDSVPCEVILQYIRENFQGKISTFENHVFFTEGEHGSTLNTGTFNSMIEMFRNFSNMRQVREEAFRAIFSQPWQPLKFKKGRSMAISSRRDVPGYAMPFIGGDKPVVSHSEFFRREINPRHDRVEIQTYFCSRSLIEIVGLAIIMGIVMLLSKFSLGRDLLYRYPHLITFGAFRKGGPTRQQTTTCGFTMFGIGTGWSEGDSEEKKPDKRIVVRLDGPEVAYIATSICLVQSAICLLKEEEKIPMQGGYLTPGFALEKTSLMQRLLRNGFKIQIVRRD